MRGSTGIIIAFTRLCEVLGGSPERDYTADNVGRLVSQLTKHLVPRHKDQQDGFITNKRKVKRK